MRTLLILALAAGGLAATADDPMSVNVTGHAYAKIVPALQVWEEKMLFFGRILQGTTGTVEIDVLGNGRHTTGSIVVSPEYSKGIFKSNAPMGYWNTDDMQQINNDVKVKFIGPNDPNWPFTKTIQLVNPSDPEHPLTMDATLEVNAWVGQLEFYVGGVLTVPEGAAPGLYSGTYDVTVSYL